MRQYALSAARASCGTAEIMTTRGIFPQSGASWAFNLALTVITLERVMNLGENRIEMRVPRSPWFPCDLRFPHS